MTENTTKKIPASLEIYFGEMTIYRYIFWLGGINSDPKLNILSEILVKSDNFHASNKVAREEQSVALKKSTLMLRQNFSEIKENYY